MIIHQLTTPAPVVSQKTVCALGDFDGIHLGHKHLLERTRTLAEHLLAVPAAFTFSENSKTAFSPERDVLSDPAQKEQALLRMGMQIVFSVPFASVRELDPRSFFTDILLHRCNIAGVVCGFNFHFGKDAKGDAALLAAFAKEYNIAYACIPAIKVCGETVSSSKIRALLQLGAVDQATALLGRPYTITGRVTRGRRLGHSLGFPTANLALPTGIVVPADGVYITRVRVNGALFDAVTDIGYKPTVSHTVEKICESHLLNGETELYGATISVSFLKRLRNEIRFQDAADLTRQIHTDVADAQAFFNLHPLHTV